MKQLINIPVGNNRPNVIERVQRYLLALPADKAFTVQVEPYKRTRSGQQNAYLWGVCYETMLKQEALAGWDAADLHEYFLGEWSGWETLEGFGKKRMKPVRRSSKLTTTEFAEFVDFIQRKAAELGVFIPDPREFE